MTADGTGGESSVTVNDGGRKLTFCTPSPDRGEGWYDFEVRLVGPNLVARVRVADMGGRTVADFFDALAANSGGWDGSREWGSLEDQLNLSATVDRAGHVSCDVSLRDDPGPSGWAVTLTIMIESGAQLHTFARDLRHLFADHMGT